MPFLERWVRPLFVSSRGLRVWLRLVVFLLLVIVLGSLAGLLLRLLVPSPGPILRIPLNKGQTFGVFVLASLLMARIERRSFSDYGLPWRRALGGSFWLGASLGFLLLSGLVFALWLSGALAFRGLSHEGNLALWALGWAAGFVVVGLEEEFFYRGYALLTLSEGIGFWPAAVLLSALFGFVHRGNASETPAGLVNAALFGLVACLFLRRTGNLWFSVGFHAAWDWAETAFYGVPDSGQVAPGHLFETAASGPAWLSGGSVGPEGSALCTLLLIAVAVAFALWRTEALYPTPAPAPPGTPGDTGQA